MSKKIGKNDSEVTIYRYLLKESTDIKENSKEQKLLLFIADVVHNEVMHIANINTDEEGDDNCPCTLSVTYKGCKKEYTVKDMYHAVTNEDVVSSLYYLLDAINDATDFDWFEEKRSADNHPKLIEYRQIFIKALKLAVHEYINTNGSAYIDGEPTSTKDLLKEMEQMRSLHV